MDQAGLTLYTFATSNYSEKIRWALSVSRVPFKEVIMTPVLHYVPMLRMGGTWRSIPPILQEISITGRRTHIEDSKRIMAWLDERHGPLGIFPQGAELREECLSVEARFDVIGLDVARFIYNTAFANNARVLSIWTSHAKPWEARLVSWLYPAIKRNLSRQLDLSPDAITRSEQRILQSLAWLEGRLSDGRTHLVGSRLSVADITVAAMLAPLACPPQHPVYGDLEYIRSVRGQRGPWRLDRPAFVWVRRLYHQYRGELVFPQVA